MVLEEWVGCITFSAAVGSVYASLGAMAIRAGWRWKKHLPAPKRGFCRRWGRRGIYLASIVGVACFAYAYFWEPYHLETSEVKLTSSKIRHPLRLALISDLHCDSKVRLEDELVRMIAQRKPDAILFAGDATNGPGGLANFRRCIDSLAAVAPTYAVLGNVDCRLGLDLYSFSHVHVLTGTGIVPLGPAGEVQLVGGPPEGEQAVWTQLEHAPSKAYRVALFHYPQYVFEAAQHGADLYLCGHTHGGQIALPGYGALVTQSGLGKRFERGLYRVRDTWMYITRGIGMEGTKGGPPVRFGSTPEVVFIELQAETPIPQ